MVRQQPDGQSGPAFLPTNLSDSRAIAFNSSRLRARLCSRARCRTVERISGQSDVGTEIPLAARSDRMPAEPECLPIAKGCGARPVSSDGNG